MGRSFPKISRSISSRDLKFSTVIALNPIRPGLFGAPQAWGVFSSPLDISVTTNARGLKFGTKLVYHKSSKKMTPNFFSLPWKLDDVIKK